MAFETFYTPQRQHGISFPVYEKNDKGEYIPIYETDANGNVKRGAGGKKIEKTVLIKFVPSPMSSKDNGNWSQISVNSEENPMLYKYLKEQAEDKNTKIYTEDDAKEVINPAEGKALRQLKKETAEFNEKLKEKDSQLEAMKKKIAELEQRNSNRR